MSDDRPPDQVEDQIDAVAYHRPQPFAEGVQVSRRHGGIRAMVEDHSAVLLGSDRTDDLRRAQ